MTNDRKTMDERICEKDKIKVWSGRPREQGVIEGESEGGVCDEMIMCRIRLMR